MHILENLDCEFLAAFVKKPHKQRVAFMNGKINVMNTWNIMVPNVALLMEEYVSEGKCFIEKGNKHNIFNSPSVVGAVL